MKKIYIFRSCTSNPRQICIPGSVTSILAHLIVRFQFLIKTTDSDSECNYVANLVDFNKSNNGNNSTNSNNGNNNSNNGNDSNNGNNNSNNSNNRKKQ